MSHFLVVVLPKISPLRVGPNFGNIMGPPRLWLRRLQLRNGCFEGSTCHEVELE